MRVPTIYNDSGRFGLVVTAIALVMAMTPVAAGTLRLGTPQVRDNEYTFPVVLQGDAEEVAALDFRLAYDPAVFSPVGAQSGQTAIRAQKHVSSNVAAPGEFVVVLMGFNQSSVAPGEVVQVVLEKIGTPTGGSTTLQIAEPTLATNVGVEINSRGVGRTVRFTDPGEDKADRDQARNDDTAESGDTTASNRRDGNTNAGEDDDTKAPSGGPIFVAALDAEDRGDGEKSSNKADGSGSSNARSDGNATGPQGTRNSAGGMAPGTEAASNSPDSGTVDSGSGSRAQDGTAPSANPERVGTAGADAQPKSIKALTTTTDATMEGDEKRGGQRGTNYATILLLSGGAVVGALILLRAATR